MKTQLHLLVRPADDLVRSLLEAKHSSGDVQVEIFDLTQGEPDYARLVERIFEADSVVTW